MRRLLRGGNSSELRQAGCAPAPFAMNDISSVGVRLVMRVVLLQSGCAAAVGLLFWVLQGAPAGLSGLTGGLIVALGSGVFGWRFFAPGVAPAAVLHRALFAAESLKWLWYVIAVWAALARFRLAPLPLMTGLIVAQFGYWFGLIGMKRGVSNGGV
jgi:F0F1-type ATP synthase assembly protein I